jgi:DNA gyrase subunit A
VLISKQGMVQRIIVRGIAQYGRGAQGVKVMNVREEDVVSAVALVVESEAAVLDDATTAPDRLELGADGAFEVQDDSPEAGELLDDDFARASEASLDEAELPDEPDETEFDGDEPAGDD